MRFFITVQPMNDYYWTNHPTYEKARKNDDAGLDVPTQTSIIVPANAKSFKINLNYKGKQNHAYMLVPRSSLGKTGIRLANSIGIIDKNYRGEVGVHVDNNSDSEFLIQEGCCYFQIVSFDGKLPEYQLGEVPTDTPRGTNGFGSTGATG
jgi:deoxyuridine 5'-triphosphate nucleotidohydrolase